jgi:hypothetical protein
LACNPAKRNWEKAFEQNSVAGYKEFLQKYPDSEFSVVAAHRYDSLDWIQTLATVDSTKMADYLVNHPQGRYIETAKLILDSLEWEMALTVKDTARISALVLKNPNSKFREKGEETLWEAKWLPVKPRFISSILIWKNGSADMYDEYTNMTGRVLNTNGIPFDEIVASHSSTITITDNSGREISSGEGDGMIFIWRNFSPSEVEKASKIGLKTGYAFLSSKKGYRLIRKVDLNRTDNQIRSEFGF